MKIEKYLSELDSHLHDITATEKAEYIIKIKEQFQTQVKNHPDKNLDQIIQEFGPAINLANQFRRDHNYPILSIRKEKSFLKFIFTFFGFSFLFFIAIMSFVIWKFTPVFQIEEKSNRIVILGGLIDINGKSGRIKMMDSYHYVDNQFTNSFDGAININKDEYDELVINFRSGVIDILQSEDRRLSWDCKLDKVPTQEFINKSKGIIEMDLENQEGISCDIEIPSQMKLSIDGKDGKISIRELDSDIFVELNNGMISFAPNPELEYVYEIDIEKGTSYKFENSKTVNAIEVKFDLDNGTITKLQL
jgi:hypothetical protein